MLKYTLSTLRCLRHIADTSWLKLCLGLGKLSLGQTFALEKDLAFGHDFFSLFQLRNIRLSIKY